MCTFLKQERGAGSALMYLHVYGSKTKGIHHRFLCDTDKNIYIFSFSLIIALLCQGLLLVFDHSVIFRHTDSCLKLYSPAFHWQKDHRHFSWRMFPLGTWM